MILPRFVRRACQSAGQLLLAAAGRSAAPIAATAYEAARTDASNAQHWSATSALDADALNSQAVRQRISQRARYETANNGLGKGVTLTQANYVVGRGPTLRMQSPSKSFNGLVEARWTAWQKRVRLARKLRTAVKAKVTDGETFLVAFTNPNLGDPVKLDVRGIECEQCQSPDLPFLAEDRVDGIAFDPYGNPLYYEILPRHPGSEWAAYNQTPERVPARFVFHLFREDRPGQHRAVSELAPTLNLFADGRRYREATVAAAENIANWSILLKTQQTPEDGPDLARPFSTLPIEKGMMVQLPFGHEAWQPKAEQPTATWGEFTRSLASDAARPVNMPYNIATADSSGYSFSGGRLDHLTYFVAVDTEQADLEDLVLDPLFALWYEEASRVYGWVERDAPPTHAWAWPKKPTIDEVKKATAEEKRLKSGTALLSRLFAEDGLDYEDELPRMAADYGLTPDEMRRALFAAHFGGAPAAAAAGDNRPRRQAAPPPTGNANGRLRV